MSIVRDVLLNINNRDVRGNPNISIMIVVTKGVSMMIHQSLILDKDLVRPLLRTYTHVGIPVSSKFRDLTDEERYLYAEYHYYKFEEFGPEKFPRTGSFWKKEKFDKVHFGCGSNTTICLDIAVNYANNPQYYKTAFCAKCMNYFKVGETGSFVWKDSLIRVGT